MTKRTQTLPSTHASKDPQAASDNRPKGTLTLLEAAERLGMTSAGVHAHIRRGKLKATKLREKDGRWHWYIDEQDLEPLAEHLRHFHGIKSPEERAKEAEYARIWQDFFANAQYYVDILSAANKRLAELPKAKEPLTRRQGAELLLTCLQEVIHDRDPEARSMSEKERGEWIDRFLALQDWLLKQPA